MRRYRRALPLIFTAILALLATSVLPGAQNPPAPQDQSTFRAGTSLVPVDVRVLDRTGKPVTDLTAADFTVLEDNVKQSVRHFSTEAYTGDTPASPTPAGPAPAAAPPAARGAGAVADLPAQTNRFFLLVLARGRIQSVAKGMDGLIHFVQERLLPTDKVAVLAWNRASDFTTDHAAVAELLERFKRADDSIETKLKNHFSGLTAVYGSKDIPPDIQNDVDAVFGPPKDLSSRRLMAPQITDAARIEEDTRRATDLIQGTPATNGIAQPLVDSLGSLDEFASQNAQTMQDVGNLYTGIEYLRNVDGEKHLIFVAESTPLLPRADDDKNIASYANDARVVVDYIHTGGVAFSMGARGADANPRGATPSLISVSRIPTNNNFELARTLTGLTGGRFYGDQFTKAATDLDYIDEATRFEYLLGYYPTNANFNGKYRNIVVRVNRPGLTVLYRHGYYGQPDATSYDKRGMLTYSRVTAAANYDKEVPDIGVQATVTMPKADGEARQVTVDVTIDPTRIVFTRAPATGRNTAAVDVAVFSVRDGGKTLLGQSWQTLELTFSDGNLADLKRNGLHHQVKMSVPIPAQDVKVIVYDYDADLVGSIIVKVK